VVVGGGCSGGGGGGGGARNPQFILLIITKRSGYNTRITKKKNEKHLPKRVEKNDKKKKKYKYKRCQICSGKGIRKDCILL
jgi:hypothetical protein